MHIDQNSSSALVKVRGQVPLLRGSGQALWQRGTDRTVEVGCGVLLLECGQLHAGLAGQPPPPPPHIGGGKHGWKPWGGCARAPVVH